MNFSDNYIFAIFFMFACITILAIAGIVVAFRYLINGRRKLFYISFTISLLFLYLSRFKIADLPLGATFLIWIFIAVKQIKDRKFLFFAFMLLNFISSVVTSHFFSVIWNVIIVSNIVTGVFICLYSISQLKEGETFKKIVVITNCGSFFLVLTSILIHLYIQCLVMGVPVKYTVIDFLIDINIYMKTIFVSLIVGNILAWISSLVYKGLLAKN